MRKPRTAAGRAHAGFDYGAWQSGFGIGDKDEEERVRSEIDSEIAQIELEAEADLDDLWQRFRQWEERAAEKGSGMNRDQMLGALMFRNWMKAEEETETDSFLIDIGAQ